MSYLLTALQESHLPNLHRLGVIGKLVRNGSLLYSYTTSGELRIGVWNTETIAEAHDLLDTNPMVKAGRLIFEVNAWMVGKGILR